jgi:hypothetical protein
MKAIRQDKICTEVAAVRSSPSMICMLLSRKWRSRCDLLLDSLISAFIRTGAPETTELSTPFPDPSGQLMPPIT